MLVHVSKTVAILLLSYFAVWREAMVWLCVTSKLWLMSLSLCKQNMKVASWLASHAFFGGKKPQALIKPWLSSLQHGRRKAATVLASYTSMLCFHLSTTTMLNCCLK